MSIHFLHFFFGSRREKIVLSTENGIRQLAFEGHEIDISDLVAGIILEGTDSAVSLSDYVLGPSHILPTNSSARFSSPLSVEDFLISSSKVAEKLNLILMCGG